MAAGSRQPFLSSCNPPRLLNTGVTCAWSQHWWMLGGNHGNCQVSVSLPLTVTLRCHHVPVTGRAPHVPLRSCHLWSPGCPGTRGAGMRWQQGCAGDHHPHPGTRAGSRCPTPPRLCWGSRGSPRPRGQETAPWSGEGIPAPPHRRIPAAGSIPARQRRRKEPREMQQSNICKRLTTQPARPFPK